jgi:hypothetical protein
MLGVCCRFWNCIAIQENKIYWPVFPYLFGTAFLLLLCYCIREFKLYQAWAFAFQISFILFYAASLSLLHFFLTNCNGQAQAIFQTLSFFTTSRFELIQNKLHHSEKIWMKLLLAHIAQALGTCP